jgi:hypothetical protein
LSLAYDAPTEGPRHRRQCSTEPRPRAALTVAEALRSQFPLGTGPGPRRAGVTVAEALRSRFPPAPRTPADAGAVPPGGPALPRRIRGISLSAAARRAEPLASHELLCRVLDGLQRL